MRFEPPLLDAEFVSRPQRFVARVRLRGRLQWAHVHDPGRLAELLVPQARLLLRRVRGRRRTGFDVMLVRRGAIWVSVYASLPNRLVAEKLSGPGLPELGGPAGFRKEVPLDGQRFDFRIATSPPTWLEVKSVTLVERRTALFPDAPTARGRRHVEALAGMARRGARCAVLFVVQRPDADRIRPHADRDPQFAAALCAARGSGVGLWGRVCRVGRRRIELGRAIPVEPA